MKDFREWHNSDVAKLLSPPILKIRNQIKAIGSKIFSIFVENRIYYEEKNINNLYALFAVYRGKLWS